jgi:hypothetical protein
MLVVVPVREMNKGIVARLTVGIGLTDQIDALNDPQGVGVESVGNPLLGDVGKYVGNENTERRRHLWMCCGFEFTIEFFSKKHFNFFLKRIRQNDYILYKKSLAIYSLFLLARYPAAVVPTFPYPVWGV